MRLTRFASGFASAEVDEDSTGCGWPVDWRVLVESESRLAFAACRE
jgi:hypothetical protein